ncbi:hypothetical protein G9A89_004875 [Geosiphon pyriformis]|nr:hypothetical protein G9A89_004875 [Geosiphon pyriformis]
MISLILFGNTVHFSQANNINFVIARAVNESSFVVLGSNFNKDGFQRCASFKKCLDLGLVNFLGRSSYIKMSTWANSQSMIKTIDFLFISLNLVNAVVDYEVSDVGEFFDTDYHAVFVSVSLSRLLDKWLNFLHKQVNRDQIVRVSHKKSIVNFDSLMRCWIFLNNVKTLVIQEVVDSGTNSGHVRFVFFGVRKYYHAAKFAEFLRAKEANVRSVIDRQIESFETNKSHTIKSVLEHPFHKVVLDYLVVDDKLILEPNSIRSKEGWTRKHGVVADVFNVWSHQYWPLDYVFNEAFSGVMHSVKFSKLFNVIFNLPNDKAAGLLGITNELVVENALEKNREFWLVLQNMQKAYDSVSWKHLEKSLIKIKMCSLSRPSLVKANSDIRFFTNLVLRKAVSNKQFLYLVLAVLYPIKKLNSYGLVPEWFKLSVAFLNDKSFSFIYFSVSDGIGFLNILESSDFASVCNRLSQVSANSLLVYTDGSLSNLGTVGYRAGAAVFFENIDLGLGIGVSGLISFTLAELQTITLALESVPLLSSVNLFLDSQFVLDAYKSELGLAVPDFYNQCWVKHCHIVNVIHSKNLKVSWHKVKGHSGVSGNECTDIIAGDASLFTGGSVVGFGSKFLVDSLLSEVDWFCSSLVWHSDLYMAAGFTSRPLANVCTYFMKALYHQLPVVIQKCLYNRLYPSVLCLYCGNVEVSNHVFSYKIDDFAVSGLFYSFLGILQLLSLCVSDFSLFMAFYKGFIFNDWFCEAVTIFQDPKIAGLEIIKFVCSFSLDFRNNVWSVYAKHCAFMKKNRLISLSGLVLISVSGLASGLLVGIVKLLGIANAFGVHFGFCKSCLFFLDISDLVLVHIAV